MNIERRIIKKWTKITLFCGAHSFFWGAMGGGSILAMIAGLITLILMFSVVESHPAYQAKRAGSALFAKAMDVGIKIRIYFAAYILLSGALMAMGAVKMSNAVTMILAYPYMGEMWIGMGASMLCTWLTGLSLEKTALRGDYDRTSMPIPQNAMDNIIATYSTTIITGLLHTIILALLCTVIYLVLHRKKTA